MILKAIKLESKKIICCECLIGLIFGLSEILIVLGETFGLIEYNSNLDSFLFIIFLALIIYYENKKKSDLNIKT